VYFDVVGLYAVDNIVDYDWSSGRYSSWSESQWPVDAFQVRIFLMPSYEQQVWLQFLCYCYLAVAYY